MTVDPKVVTGDASEVLDLARKLGEAITELPEYQEFADAKRRVENSEELQNRIGEFEQLRQDFMLAQQTGEATQEDVTKIQRVQDEIDSHPFMEEYNEAMTDLTVRLADVNFAISEPLPFEFADEAGGSCCED